MDKILIMIMLISLVLITTSCDMELVHTDHDHDGDGVQDHLDNEHDEPQREQDRQRCLCCFTGRGTEKTHRVREGWTTYMVTMRRMDRLHRGRGEDHRHLGHDPGRRAQAQAHYL